MSRTKEAPLLISKSEYIGPINTTSTPYVVNVPAGTELRVNVRDVYNRVFVETAFTNPIEVGELRLSVISDDYC